jgi:hypothetical protein
MGQWGRKGSSVCYCKRYVNLLNREDVYSMKGYLLKQLTGAGYLIGIPVKCSPTLGGPHIQAQVMESTTRARAAEAKEGPKSTRARISSTHMFI